MTTSFGPQKIGTKTYHTLHPRFLSKQPNIRSEKNTPILQPCWWSCSSNVKRKCSICDANSSLFLHQIMDQSAPQQIIISHHLSWTAMSFSQQSQPTRFLLSHQPGETIYMYELVLQFNGRPQRSSTAGAAGQGPWLEWKGASLLDRLVHGYVFSELSLATPKFNPELSENMWKLHKETKKKSCDFGG